MIIPRIFGGLGNQLFCYAAARRLSLINDAELVLDDVSGFLHDHIYMRHYQLDHFHIPCRKATNAERLEPFSRLRRKLKREINRCRPFEQRRYIQQEGRDFDSRLLNLKPQGTLYLEGYWQSEGYFKDVESTIRQDFRINPPTDTVNLEMADQINDRTAVAVHVRFFDEPQATTCINNAPTGYYARAIAEMERRVPEAHYFLFSDNPSASRSRIPLSNDRITLVFHNKDDINAYADLWLMSQCKHFIIANSTFSWWGAWLANWAGKLVIAPCLTGSQGYRSWGFKGLLPDEWCKL